MLKTAGELTGAFFESEATDTLVERNNAPRPVFSLINDMFVEPGGISDWELLHDLHYKAERLPMGPRFWKLTLYGETIGVLVTAIPKGLLKERHLVMPNLKPGSGDTKITNTARFVWINANIRVISRFVVDTMYRGIGAGYRMMNLVSRMEGPTFMEIQSSMSKFNYFGQRAGFKFAAPMNANSFGSGMKFFRSNFDANPQDFEAIVAEIEAKSPAEQEQILTLCKAFYFKHSSLEQTGGNRLGGKGQRRVEAMNTRTIVKAIQQVALASPLYGVYKNPDRGRDIPQRLPLSAFDRQNPNEPLVLV
jgi:ABC-type ATPase with predicted acetyltransferase domain